MSEAIKANKLSRFGLSADFSHCLIEFEKEGGQTERLMFPAGQLDEVIGLLLQVRQLHADRSEGGQRSALVAERVGVAFQPEAQVVVLDFVVGGAPISFAVQQPMAVQLMQYFKEKLPAP